jgi:hypothetical protein
MLQQALPTINGFQLLTQYHATKPLRIAANHCGRSVKYGGSFPNS